jgi:phospholipid/cholesterol/gamma-HCH transport system permease protein
VPHSSPSFQLERETTREGARLSLRGRCELADAEALWQRLRRALQDATISELDLAGVESMDGACAALVQGVVSERRAAGGELRLVEASSDVARMLGLYACAEDAPCAAQAPSRPGAFDQIGRATVGMLTSMRDVLAFVGDLTISARRAMRERGSVNLRAVPHLMERAGADGVPIVLLINFLVGLIIGLQAAYQLERFGANIFVANLVGLSMVRELAPLMTAIVVAGRSGASYAAELGTMRVNQEIDALRTLGIDPYRFLVFPRMIATSAVVPLLTIASMLVGVLGGLIIAVQNLGLTTTAYFNQLQGAVGLVDVAGGLLKSVVFAITITLISCQRGLSTRGGAAGVGNSTTSAVVVILFFLVVLDAIFTVGFNLFGI